VAIFNEALVNNPRIYTAGFFKPATVTNESYQITAQFLSESARLKCPFEMPVGLKRMKK